jgi:hypothetical protein
MGGLDAAEHIPAVDPLGLPRRGWPATWRNLPQSSTRPPCRGSPRRTTVLLVRALDGRPEQRPAPGAPRRLLSVHCIAQLPQLVRQNIPLLLTRHTPNS